MKKILILIAFAIVAINSSSFFLSNVVLASGLTPPTSTSGEVKATELKDNPIVQWIEFFINVLSVTILAGSSVMIAWAGIQYMSARDNAQAVQAAKQKIWNVVFGLIAYFFLYAFIQWLVPGGVF